MEGTEGGEAIELLRNSRTTESLRPGHRASTSPVWGRAEAAFGLLRLMGDCGDSNEAVAHRCVLAEMEDFGGMEEGEKGCNWTGDVEIPDETLEWHATELAEADALVVVGEEAGVGNSDGNIVRFVSGEAGLAGVADKIVNIHGADDGLAEEKFGEGLRRVGGSAAGVDVDGSE